MDKSNGQKKDIAARVKAALAPKPKRITRFALTLTCDVESGFSDFKIVRLMDGALDLADLYAAIDAARRYVMQMEQQSILQQAAAQAQPGAAGQLAEAVTTPTPGQAG